MIRVAVSIISNFCVLFWKVLNLFVTVSPNYYPSCTALIPLATTKLISRSDVVSDRRLRPKNGDYPMCFHSQKWIWDVGLQMDCTDVFGVAWLEKSCWNQHASGGAWSTPNKRVLWRGCVAKFFVFNIVPPRSQMSQSYVVPTNRVRGSCCNFFRIRSFVIRVGYECYQVRQNYILHITKNNSSDLLKECKSRIVWIRTTRIAEQIYTTHVLRERVDTLESNPIFSGCVRRWAGEELFSTDDPAPLFSHASFQFNKCS